MATLVLLFPLLLLLGRAIPYVLQAPLLLSYGCLVLASTIVIFYLAYTRYADPAVHPPSAHRRGRDTDLFVPLPAQPTVSFLVAVRNEESGIEACVHSMVAGDLDGVQVIVVDDASTDGTPDVLRELARELPIEVLFLEENVGKKRALVRAMERAKGDVIAFTDSDCVLAADALSRCVTALVRHPELGAVSGHARALNAEQSVLSRAQDVWYEGQFRVIKAAESVFGAVVCVSGPLAVFRRDAIYNYLPAWAEDRFLGAEFRFATDRQLTGYVLGQRYRGRGLKRRHADSPFVRDVDYPELAWRTSYVRSARVWTTVPDRLRPFLRQQIRWKKSFIRNIFFTGTFIWRRGVGAAALYYVHMLWVLAAPVLVIRHLLWEPLTGMWLMTWLYLSGVVIKGFFWGMAFKFGADGSSRWRYRLVMSLLSSVLLSWLLPYAAVTIRRKHWFRGAS
ncbi:glycosyltransferase [Nonomuraea sp. LP-02]|uniref:glycosyltransferase family 2 protein n=1 Tax=Nonomuraea sp. LP-02 TaxID=3097960 RepID=UPI002E3416D9|nr:glycosyltransferase [Nonomuraea sp. LP-02]MED7924346.1 glycosyltransferase [Nonomuraea sp. LP-02]